MKTILTRSATEAAAFIRRRGIVAFPTETVYGLGANVFDERAIRKIFDAKLRPSDNPLIAHVSVEDQIREIAADVPPPAKKLIDAFFPGPLTIVLKKIERVPHVATAGLETIGIRMPALQIARHFLSECGVPVVAPSANLSGRPSPTTWQAVQEDLDGRIDCILQGDATEIGLESTVIDCTSETPILLRMGAIPLERLRMVVPEISFVQTSELETPRSPGLKHKHYSPRAGVVLVDAGAYCFQTEDDIAFIGLTKPLVPMKTLKLCRSVEEYAASLFEFFRECDRANIKTIYCEAVAERGIGAALVDRIRRAASD
ncbi:L-threonylcarbamoyladenylate synthase [soil metagenome]